MPPTRAVDVDGEEILLPLEDLRGLLAELRREALLRRSGDRVPQGAGADPELRVRAREARLDRAAAEEELRRALAVRQPARGELGDRLLADRQLRRGAADADPGELGPRLLGPEPRAERLEQLDGP